MVRNAQMTTKFGAILANFIEGPNLPFSNTASDIFLRLAPHQSASLTNVKATRGNTNVGQKEVDVACVCIENDSKKVASIDTLLSKLAKEARSLVWLDPTLIPTECLSCVFTKWLANIKPSDNSGLGIVIPKSNAVIPSKNNFTAWASSPEGSLRKEFDKINLPVWYPSLSREPELLGRMTSTIKPFDIFPIVEFPKVINYDSEKENTMHHYVLDHYRTRTRNLIYLNDRCPDEALITLFGSFEAVTRNGRMPRSLLITPGGTSLSYLITLLAGVFSGGIFITTEKETPFLRNHEVWGFAIFEKCE